MHAILVLCAAALIAPGGGGLRSLHLAHAEGTHAAEAGCSHGHEGHGHGRHGDRCDGHDDAAPADASGTDDAEAPHDELSCATCELLLSLAGTAVAGIEVPAFHALVAACDGGAPARLPAPLPLRALAARPPPAC